MPKTIGTRKQKARELFRTLEDGPAFHKDMLRDSVFTVEQAKAQYQIWVQSWVLRQVKSLIPELRDQS